MKKIILVSVIVVVLLVAGVSTYVSMIDWNKHKQRLATQISEVIGKKVEFSGNIGVSYSLHPEISAQDVNIINPQTNETLAKISQLKTNVSLLSLLKGAPDIQSLYLVEAELWVTLDDKGQTGWLKNQSSDLVESNAFLMQTINIVNSKLHFNDTRHNLQFDLSALTAEIRAEGVNGPYRLDGNFMKDNERYGTAFSIDGMSQLDDINLMFVILHQGSNSYVRYDGSYNINSNIFKGFVKGDFKRTADFINAVSGQKFMPEFYNMPLQFSVDAYSDTEKIALTHFSIAFSQILTGSGEINIAKKTREEEERLPMTIKYQFRDLDLRPLIGQLKERIAQYQKGQKFEFVWPYDTDYDLSAIRVIISDKPEGSFENVSAKGKITADSFSVDDFYAGCAGNIVLNITGNLTAPEGIPHCSAKITADGRNFRSMINSLGFDLEAPVQGAYQTGKITAGIKITPNNISVEDLQSTIDKSNIKLSADISLPDESCNIDLTADKINLDKYIFPLGQDMPKDFETALLYYLKGIAKLQNKKINLQAKVAELTFNGVPAYNLQTETKYDKDNLIISRAVTDNILGTAAEISGTISDIKSSKPQIDSFDFSLKSSDLLPLIKKLNLPLPEWSLFSQKDTIVTGSLSGDLDKATLKLKAAAGEDSFDYDGTIQSRSEQISADADFMLKTTQLDKLLNKTGLTDIDKSYRGAFNGKAHIRGYKDDFSLEQADFKIGSSQYTGNISVKKQKNIYSVRGDIAANEMNLAQFIKIQKEKNPIVPTPATGDTFIAKPNLSKEPFDFSAYRNLDLDINLNAQKVTFKNLAAEKLKLRLIGSNGILLLQNISAEIKGAEVSGNTKIEYTQTPKILGSLIWNKIKLDNFGGSIYALSSDNIHLILDFETSLQSTDSILSALSGNAKIKTSEFKIKGIDLAAIEEDLNERKHSKGLFQTIQKALQSGITTFNPVDATVPIKNGVLDFNNIVLRNARTNATLSGNVNLKDWRINTSMKITYTLLPDIPPYSFDLTGALNKPIIDISIGDVAHKYDDYWDKIAQEEQAEKEKIKKAMDERASQIKTQIISLVGRVDGLIKMAESYAAKKIVIENIFKYNAKKERLGEMLRELQTMQSNLNKPDITNDGILQTERQVQVLRQEINIINEEIESYLLNDINYKLDDIYKKVDNENSNCTQSMELFDTLLNTNSEKLKQLNSEQNLLNNDLIAKEHKTALAAINEAGGIYNDFTLQYEKVTQMPDDLKKVDAILNLEQLYTQLQQQCINIMEARRAASAVMSEITDKRREEYEIEQIEAEKKRQREAAEDAGNLLVEAKTEETETIINPQKEAAEIRQNTVEATPSTISDKSDKPAEVTLPEAPKAETTPQETAAKTILIPIVDEQKTNDTSHGKIIRIYESRMPAEDVRKPEKSPSGILRPVEGAVPKPSGTIIVK